MIKRFGIRNQGRNLWVVWDSIGQRAYSEHTSFESASAEAAELNS